MDIAGLEDRMIAATVVMDKHVSSHRRLHSSWIGNHVTQPMKILKTEYFCGPKSLVDFVLPNLEFSNPRAKLVRNPRGFDHQI